MDARGMLLLLAGLFFLRLVLGVAYLVTSGPEVKSLHVNGLSR